MSDAIVIGGGFFGCCAALRLARAGLDVTVIQARVHTGFHYPRSFVTALRSLGNYTRFTEDFRPAIRDDFTMLYAVAREGSKVSARRFLSMFAAMGAPIARAPERHRRLFSAERVEDVFACREFAFDYTVLRTILRERLDAEGIDIRLGTEVLGISTGSPGLDLDLASGERLSAPLVINATYGGVNRLLARSGEPPLPVKFEVAEIALCEPPPELERLGVTVMDGPFFSCMPYPSRGLHSLTHVRHTPRASWIDIDGDAVADPGAVLGRLRGDSAAPLMRRDAARLMPCMEEARLAGSLVEVKAVLMRNEADDGRPILFHPHRNMPGLHTVLGGKLDNVYDLEEAMAPLARAPRDAAMAPG